MFTFGCPVCYKVHSVPGAFKGGHRTQCLRCGEPIQLTRNMVQVSEDDGSLPPTVTFPTFIPPQPAPPPQAEPPPKPARQSQHRPAAVTPPAPSAGKKARGKQVPAADGPRKSPADRPAPAEAGAQARPRRRRWGLVGGVAGLVLLLAGVGVYLVAATGKPRTTPRVRTPAPGGAPQARATPPAPAPTGSGKTAPSRPRPAAREVVAAALAADPRRFRQVRLAEADFHEPVLTLRGTVHSSAVKQEVEQVAVDAMRQAGLATEVRVENHLREPLEVVQEAIARKFGKGVTVTTVRLDRGRLLLEGTLSRWGDLQPAREQAVHALEEAGLGPITAWENHLKKPMR